MNVKGICSYKIVKMMMCTHTNTKSDSRNMTCTDCGILQDTDIMTIAVDNALDMASRKIANEILNSGRGYTVCDHISKDTDGGTPFCTKCGLMFEDEEVYANEVYNMDYHHQRTPDEIEGKADKVDPKPEKASPKPRKADPRPNPKAAKAKSKSKAKEPEITPRGVKDLITIAKGRGIKGSTSMSKKKLCDILGLEIVKPDRLTFRNKGTGEEHKFKSIYQASKEMGVNPGSIYHHMNSSGVIEVGGVTYDVCETQASTG